MDFFVGGRWWDELRMGFGDAVLEVVLLKGGQGTSERLSGRRCARGALPAARGRGVAVFAWHGRDGCRVSGSHYFAPSGLPRLGRFAVPGHCPGLFYCALSGRKEESPVTWHHAVGVAREQSWARCPCHKTSRRFSCSAACIRKEIGESKAKDPAATEIEPHPAGDRS